MYFLFNPVNFICLEKATFCPIWACVGYFVANPHTLGLLYTGPVLCCIFMTCNKHYGLCLYSQVSNSMMFYCDVRCVIFFVFFQCLSNILLPPFAFSFLISCPELEFFCHLHQTYEFSRRDCKCNALWERKKGLLRTAVTIISHDVLSMILRGGQKQDHLRWI